MLQARVALALLFLTACGARPPAPTTTPAAKSTPRPNGLGAVWISPSLGLNGGQAAAALRKPFAYSINVTKEKTSAVATSCEDYFRLKADGYGAVSEEEHNLWRSEGVRCEAIERAATMKPANGEPAKEMLADQELLRHLPATIGPSVSRDELALRTASEAQGRAWGDYAPGATVEKAETQIIVREPDTISRLTPLASGDLDGDGYAELLLEAVCNGTEGTWVDIRLLVISSAAGGEGKGPMYRLVDSIAP